MKTTTLINGTILIIIGIFFLLRNLGIPISLPLTNLIRLWPMLLVVLGLKLLFPRGLLALLAPLVLIFTVIFAFWGMPATHHDYITTNLALPANTENATLIFSDLPVANLTINAGQSLENTAIEGLVSEIVGDIWHVSHTETESSYTLEKTKENSFKFWLVNSNYPANLQLNPNVNWNTTLDVAVAMANIDLRNLTWQSVNINSGINYVTITLDKESAGTVKIKNGIGKISLKVPKELAMEITTTSPSILHNFEEQGLIYTDKKFISQTAQKSRETKVKIMIDSGISVINLGYI